MNEWKIFKSYIYILSAHNTFFFRFLYIILRRMMSSIRICINIRGAVQFNRQNNQNTSKIDVFQRARFARVLMILFERIIYQKGQIGHFVQFFMLHGLIGCLPQSVVSLKKFLKNSEKWSFFMKSKNTQQLCKANSHQSNHRMKKIGFSGFRHCWFWCAY